jgi:type III secretory pathway lipoprotein EscJ
MAGKGMAQLRAALAERGTRVALGGGLAVVLAAGLFVAGQHPGDGHRVLARGIRMKADVRAITSELEKQGVAYQLSDGGRTISVPEKMWDQAVRHVSREKLYPRSREQDVREVLDKSTGLTMLPDMQRLQRNRLQELEIARTISMYDSVEFARVHITQPRDAFYGREAAPVTASIFLELGLGRKLSADQVAAIKALVSHSVEGLSPMNITLCDSQGNDYSTTASHQTTAPVSPSAVRELELAQLVETVVLGKVTDHLRRLFEPETFAASVTAELEMTQVTVRPLARADASQAPRAGEDDPTKLAALSGPDTVSAQLKNVETRGRIRRLSISVLVDSRSLTSGQLDPALRQTVDEGIKAAVGFRPARGDTLSVLVAPFCKRPPAAPADRKEEERVRVTPMSVAAVAAAASPPSRPLEDGVRGQAAPRRLPGTPDSRAAGALGFVAEHFNVLWVSQVVFLVLMLTLLVRQLGAAGSGWREPATQAPEPCYPVRVDSVMGDAGAPAGQTSRPGAPVSRPGSPVARCVESLLKRKDRDVEGALARVDAETLVLALSRAAEPLRRAALARMPAERARELSGRIAAHGPVPLGQMERAQLHVADLLAEAPQKGV